MAATKFITIKGSKQVDTHLLVVELRKTVLHIVDGTFRDDFDFTPGLMPAGASTAPSTNVPVMGDDGVIVTVSSFAGLHYRAPDKVMHVAPRPYHAYHSVIVVLKAGETMPEPVSPEYSRKNFTAATSDICTSVAHGYNTGVLVKVSSTDTLPAGMTAGTIYEFVKLSDDTFKLYNNGVVVNLTTTGTGTHTVQLAEPVTEASSLIYPFYFIADKPRISDRDPRRAPVTE